MHLLVLFGVAVTMLVATTLPSRAQEAVYITEFLASNDGPVTDEDGDFSDWIEIHNAGSSTVNLLDWRLSDRASLANAWRFPATNLPPNGYLLVFASGKDRRIPGATLHTDFRLSADGEYLALIKPDGTNIASQFAPVFPQQVSGVSYGITAQENSSTLVPAGATARVLVPQNGALGESWTTVGFNDASWSTAASGVGFETDGQVPFVPSTIANSVSDFSGVQGQANWFYGYWSRIADDDGFYQDANFIPFAANVWNGTRWKWRTSEAESEINAQGGLPTGVNLTFGRPEHWVIRRYISEFDGPLRITGSITHTSDWIQVTSVGVASSSAIYIYLTGLGEGYIDDMKLVAGFDLENGSNLLPNGNFENASLTPWNVSSNLANSSLSTTIRHGGTRSLHLVSSAGGTTRESSIWQNVPGLTSGQIYAISYWYLPVTNSSPLTVRFSGGWIDTTPEPCGDGTVARILVDGNEVFQRGALVSSETYSLTVPTRIGSRVDFVLDPGAASDSECDATQFTANLETTDPTLTVVADSVADWSLAGKQGENNWFYGYFYGGTNAASPAYNAAEFIPFPRDNGPHSANNFWDGASWDWWNGDPPATEIGQRVMNPNGINAGPQHWVVRRWVSEVSGSITVDWSILKLIGSGAGVTGHVYHNGAERDIVTVAGTEVNTISRSIVINGVQAGDFIDIVLDPVGFGGAWGDGGDRSFVTATIRGRPTLTPYIASSLESAMKGQNASAYLRFPFNVTNPASIDFLTLRLQYDDGFLAYLNGQLIASANSPATPQWNSAATVSRSDGDVMNADIFNLTEFRDLLQPGPNVLAVHGLNSSANDGDFLIRPELTASTVSLNLDAPRYFAPPSPGEQNGAGGSAVGPLLTDVKRSPSLPGDSDDVVVTARVAPTFLPVGSVQLIYRTMFSNEVNVAMLDDGLHGDGAAGDGVFGATIPASASTPGQMVRYYVFTTDTSTNSARFPLFSDPQNSPEYEGFVIPDDSITSALPVLHMFAQSPTLITNTSGTRVSLAYDEEFYDNVFINLHGQTTAGVFHKRSMNVDFHRGHNFRWSRTAPRVNDINLLTPIADKSYVRQPLAYETFASAGVPSHFAFAVRIQQNNSFFGVFHLVEKGDDNFLDRVGLDPNGALYKVYLPLTNAYGGVVEKKTRRDEDYSDLQELIDGLNAASSDSLKNYLYDNVDIPEVINFLATIQLVQNEDCCGYKNYYLYRDSERTGEWQMLPWDLDLVFGRTFGFFQVGNQVINGYFNTNIYWTNLYYSQSRSSYDFIGVGQPLVNALLLTDETYEMFQRRWTSVQDEFLRPSNTHPMLLRLERRVDELASTIEPDAELDFSKWGNWAPTQTMSVAVNILKTEYFARRRGWIFNTLRFANDGPYLGPQPTNAVIQFGAIEFNPASGRQSQEYVELRNANTYAVDISGWQLDGAIQFTFRGGTVIPAGGSLYVSPDVKSFRARTSSPRGGQGVFVQGNYAGQLSARGELLTLTDQRGRLVRSTNYVGAPSLAQRYLRVTELMYHPATLAGNASSAEEFEYIELRNIGPITIPLTGVRFTSGIDFDFTGSAVTNLAAGARVLVTKNPGAFTARYGSVPNIAGTYAGSLENGGEVIRLEDATGEKILEFRYNNSWYPITDGNGFSLVIVDETAAWDTWDLKASWRASGAESGSPGTVDNTPVAFAPVLINEVLSHTDLPAVDAVELYNPTDTAVNLRGWFLSDDFSTPKKFRINADTIIAPGGYQVFTEADFNAVPALPTSFAFSSLGDEAFLFSGDASTNLTGYFHGFQFGAAANGVSFGRHLSSTGAEHFVAQIATTLGAPNSGPRVGPVVFNEIMFHPPDSAFGEDDQFGEYIELYNSSASAAPLFDPAAPTNTWQLRGGVSFDFPSGITLPTAGFALIVSFDPADGELIHRFRQRYNVPPSTPVLGPYSGKLDNSSDTLELSRPDTAVLGTVPYILVESVTYSDSAPWPERADGTGAALRRINPSLFADDPTSWRATSPSSGAGSVGSTPPTITSQPLSRIGIGSQAVEFTVAATGSNPLRYQWFFNGDALAGQTNRTLGLGNIDFDNAGNYQVVVYNPAGSVTSSNALLNVVLGAYVTIPPTNVTLRGSTNLATYGFTTNNARFSVAAIGTGPLRYQWRFNGANLSGATTSSLTVTNVAYTNDGLYDVTITDNVGTILSPPASLTVLINPTIVVPPVSLIVATSSLFTVSVEARGNPLPFGFEWRQLSALRVSNTIFATRDFPVFLAPTNFVTNQTWRVVVRNLANQALTANAAFQVTTVPDSDGDGIPDNYEIQFGLDEQSAADRDLDSDGDGMTNWEEFQAGTDPDDPGSLLRIESLEHSALTSLSFEAVPSRTYTVEFADDFELLNWQRLGDVLARTSNRVETVVDPSSNTNRYYRIVTPRRE